MKTNSKHEVRISKQIRMTKIQNQKSLGNFEHLDFVIVSDFDIRVSDLLLYKGGLK